VNAEVDPGVTAEITGIKECPTLNQILKKSPIFHCMLMNLVNSNFNIAIICTSVNNICLERLVTYRKRSGSSDN
jgi:hypothetical protein